MTVARMDFGRADGWPRAARSSATCSAIDIQPQTVHSDASACFFDNASSLPGEICQLRLVLSTHWTQL